MRLKVKILKISAGRPVAILHRQFAENTSIHVDDRIFIEKENKKLAAVVDIAVGILKEDEIALSSEIIKPMNLKENDSVNIEIAPKPESLEYIHKKLSCKKLSKEEIKEIIKDITKNNLTEAEIAYFIAGVYRCGMNMRETAELTESIITTGKRLNLKGKIADKHSIGGIPGRTTPIIVSICACTGLIIPKTSSRAITTPAGTADCLETICKVDFSISEIKKIIKKTNACLVWGGSLNLAPADDKIIQVERLLNLDPESQLLASIIAKKIAVGSKYVLIDIPCGKNAKVTRSEAIQLDKKFKELGKYFNIKIGCSIKETPEPLGNGIGPALEMRDVIKVLTSQDDCYKLKSRSLELSGQLLELTGKAKKNQGLVLARKILESGKALQKFKQIIKAQNGNINACFNKPKFSHNIISEKSGMLKEIKIKDINTVARMAGCPLSKFAGIYLYKHLNEKIHKGEKLLTIYSESEAELKEAIKHYNKSKPILIL